MQIKSLTHYWRENSPGWVRFWCKALIRTSDTRYFIDPSIAVAALDAGPEDLMNDLNTFGLIFETMAIRDLRVYADAHLGSVDH